MKAKKVASANKKKKQLKRKSQKRLREWTIRIGIIIQAIVFILFMIVAFFSTPQQIG